DAVNAAFGRGGGDLVAALAQNGDGLRANQAGPADDDDLHGLTPLSTTADLPSSEGAPDFCSDPPNGGHMNIRQSALVPCSKCAPSALHCRRTDELYVMPLFQPFASPKQGVSEGRLGVWN